MMKFIFMFCSITLWGKGDWKLVSWGYISYILMMLNLKHDFEWFMMGYEFGLDSFSFLLAVLSIWLSFLAILSLHPLKFNYFIFFMAFLMTSLVLSFSFLSILGFYASFEISLIPMLILILGWGYQPERLQAGVYMFFYTLLASLPLFLVFIKVSNFGVSWVLEEKNFTFSSICFWDLLFLLAFLVKLPMYGVHLWLPKAHVEAPVSGSMILAGILLKLGGYGIFRVLSFFPHLTKSFSVFLSPYSLLGGVMISLVCLFQGDMKALVAYSSVAHMSLVLSGLMSFMTWGVMGALVVMIGHGFCSSGLFAAVNILYQQSHTRSVYLNKGFILLAPSLALWWFLLSTSNMSAPPSLNLLGEIQLISSIMSYSWVVWGMLACLTFFSGAYSIFLFSVVNHGKSWEGMMSWSGLKVRDYLILFLHWVPLNILIFACKVFY